MRLTHINLKIVFGRDGEFIDLVPRRSHAMSFSTKKSWSQAKHGGKPPMATGPRTEPTNRHPTIDKSLQSGTNSLELPAGSDITTQIPIPQLKLEDMIHPSGETKRTIARYRAAVAQLNESINYARGESVALQLPELKVLPEDVDSDSLRQAINRMFETREAALQNPTRWERCKQVIEAVYTAISPFAKCFVALAGEVQGLNPRLSLQEMAERELKRRSEIEETLDHISRELGQVQIINRLPSAKVPSEALINNAMELRSSVMRYLSAVIRRESGRAVMTFMKGSAALDQASKDVAAAVQEFNSALAHFGHEVGFHTYEETKSISRDVKQIRQDINQLLNVSQSITKQPAFPAEKFIVPYEKNPHFIGRKKLLQDLRSKLVETTPRQYNHRIALHGLGGIGKTQIALAYVHAHKSDYDAIFWITGASQTLLLSGFQEIAKRMGLVISAEDIPTEQFAHSVLAWLRNQKSWLVVIDNLDDFSVADGLLPTVAPGKHTIITTRDPNVYGIPAEGIDVNVLDPKDAVELLIIRSKISPAVDPEKVNAEANEIVHELGYLPLAIEQASAYIRETLKDIFKYLPSYRANQKKHHKRIPKGNWQYTQAVATTWHLSFQQAEQSNICSSKLLKLLAFLNPDGILLEFLEDGKEGLQDDLRDLVDEEEELVEALGELERFSLIRRQDDGGVLVTIHRLVQAVIKNEMEDAERTKWTDSVIRLCEHAFPQSWENDMRLRCRKYQSQVLVTLSDVGVTKSLELGRLLARVGGFLNDEGKYNPAVNLLLKAIEVFTLLYGREHLETLKVMETLATTYRNQERLDEALKIHHEIVPAMTKLLGENHRETLTAMGSLAATYRKGKQITNALKIQQRALEAASMSLGDEDPVTLRAMGNLAATYRTLKRLDESQELQERVLDARRRALGEEHPDTLKAMTNLAVTFRFQKDYQRAAQMDEKVVEATKRSFGDEHPRTLLAMTSLAATYRAQKDWNRAMKLQEVAVVKRIRVTGTEHPDTLWAMARLADIYGYQRRYDDAQNLQEKVVEIRSRVFGEEHVETLVAMQYLAAIYRRRGNFEEAIKVLNKVVEARKRVLGVDNKDTNAAIRDLQLCLDAMASKVGGDSVGHNRE